MNKAVFIFTLKRYLYWRTLLSGGFLLFSFAFMIGVCWVAYMGGTMEMSRELARGLLFGPIIPLIVAYGAVSPQVANAHGLKDGEYLSLLFTRPISRFTYLLTKWASGALLVFAVILIMGAVAMAVAGVISFGLKEHLDNIFDGYAISDAVLNSCSYTAFAIFIAAFPRQWSILFLLSIIYFNMFVSMGCGAASLISSVSFPFLSKSLNAISHCFTSFFNIGVDTYHLINSAASPLTAAAVYCSNLVLYLTLATAILTMREFFYAND